MPYQIY